MRAPPTTIIVSSEVPFFLSLELMRHTILLISKIKGTALRKMTGGDSWGKRVGVLTIAPH